MASPEKFLVEAKEVAAIGDELVPKLEGNINLALKSFMILYDTVNEHTYSACSIVVKLFDALHAGYVTFFIGWCQ